MNIKENINKFEASKSNLEDVFNEIVNETINSKNYSLAIIVTDNFLCVKIQFSDNGIRPNSFFFEKMNEIGFYEFSMKKLDFNVKFNLAFEKRQLN